MAKQHEYIVTWTDDKGNRWIGFDSLDHAAKKLADWAKECPSISFTLCRVIGEQPATAEPELRRPEPKPLPKPPVQVQLAPAQPARSATAAKSYGDCLRCGKPSEQPYVCTSCLMIWRQSRFQVPPNYAAQGLVRPNSGAIGIAPNGRFAVAVTNAVSTKTVPPAEPPHPSW